MKELTNSARKEFQKCPRSYKFRYVDGIRPVESKTALSFGTAMHSLLEVYWKGLSENETDIPTEDAVRTARDAAMDFTDDPFLRETLSALFDGYVNRWGEYDCNTYATIAVEKRFNAPLMNPETGALSKTWELAGKIDAVAVNKDSGTVTIIEHKTTGSDIAPGSDYWKRLPIDGQVSGYYVGAQSIGYAAEDCVYDVIRKPTIKPLKATPVENRKYKKDGSLYATCREFDETPEEWGRRLRADIAERPDYYFQRESVARPENDLAEYLEDVWMVGKQIMDSERLNRWPRNPCSCSGFGNCDYFDVCAGFDSLDSVRFEKVDDVNAELNN